MRRFIAFGLPVFILAACADRSEQIDISVDDTDLQAVTAVSDRNMADFSKRLAAPIGLSLGLDRDTAEAEIRGYFGTTASSGAVPIFNTKILADGEYEILVTRNGLADDSVKSEQLLAQFSDGVLSDYGLRVKCYRSSSPDSWTTQICP